MRTKCSDRSSCFGGSDSGAISFQGIFILIVVVGIVWGALSLFPLFSTPMDLENKIKNTADDWLRLAAREQTQQKKRQTIEELRGVVVSYLENHTWDKKDLHIEVQRRSVVVRLPYTLNINVFGFEMKFDKEVDVNQQSYSF